MGIWIILIIFGGILFVYFNFKVICKVNLATSYLKIYISIKIIKKRHVFDRKFYYIDFFKKSRQRVKSLKSKKIYPYLKYFKKIKRLFIIKNISFYPECLENSGSFAIEFIIVNNIIKRPLFNG